MKKIFTKIFLVLTLIIVIILWKCPFENFFGIPCPGCNMTTAAYYLIQFDFKSAWYYNPVIYLLIIMAIPLTISYKKKQEWFSRLLNITLMLWLIIYIYRMMTIFPNEPMKYIEENGITHLMQIFK